MQISKVDIKKTKIKNESNGWDMLAENATVRTDGKSVMINDVIIPIAQIGADGWANLITGLGVAGKDKRMGGDAVYTKPMTEMKCEEIYASEELAAKITDKLPYDATRMWLEFNKDNAKYQEEIDRLDIQAKTFKAWRYARQYGGSAIFLNTGEKSGELVGPLEMRSVKTLKSLVVMTRFELLTDTVNSDLSSPNFNNPETYTYTPRAITNFSNSSGLNNVKIHHSRLVRFDGKELGELLRSSNDYWGDSIYTALYDALRDYGISYGSVANIIQEFRMLVYQVKGLAQALAAGQESIIRKRLEMMNLARSVIGSFMLDSDEEMNSMSAGVAGLDKLLEAMKERLQAATDIPHTILFNQSPSGLGATGRTEENIWYDHVKSQQEIYLAPKLDRIFEVMFNAKDGPTNGKEPEDWTYEFVPLKQMSEKELSEIYKNNMEGDRGYVEMGVLDSEEVTEMRFPEKNEKTA